MVAYAATLAESVQPVDTVDWMQQHAAAPLPNDPLLTIAPPYLSNSDLPPIAWPSVDRVNVTSPVVADTPDNILAQIERRTETLRTTIQSLVQFANVLDDTFVRKDATTSKDDTVGMTADLYLGTPGSPNGIHNLHDGVVAAGSHDGVNGRQVQTLLYDRITILASILAKWSVAEDLTTHTLMLSGDVFYPGTDYYYGTDINGIRGWYPILENRHP